MPKLKLHTSVIYNGVYWRAGSVINVRDADMRFVGNYGEIVAEEKPKQTAETPETPEAAPAAEPKKPVAAKKPRARSKK